jgi:hypothetical protein
LSCRKIPLHADQSVRKVKYLCFLADPENKCYSLNSRTTREASWQNNKKDREHRALRVNRWKKRFGLLPINSTAMGAIRMVAIPSTGCRPSSEYWLAERHSCAELPDHREMVIRPSLL